jgi:hypothetical protein
MCSISHINIVDGQNPAPVGKFYGITMGFGPPTNYDYPIVMFIPL